MNFQILLSVLVILSVVIAPFAMATDKVELRFDGKVLQQMQQTRSLTNDSVQNLVNAVWGPNSEMSLRLVRTISSGRDLTHSRYTMLFRGVPIWGEQIVITEGADRSPVLLHGNAITGIERDLTSVTPAFDAPAALEIAKNLHLTQSIVRDAASWTYENETSDLVVYINNGVAQLCYAVTFFADVQDGGQPTRPTYLIDANTRQAVYQFEGLTFDNGTGPGGNQKTGRYQYGVDYPAFVVSYSNGTSTMNNTNVKTVNLNGGSSGSTAYSYSGTENTVKTINGAYSPLNDAHFFGGVVFDMYKQWYNSAPLTFQLMLRVHYSTNYENAFWNGSSMTFGDGYTRFYPLVSLDVVTHEVSHGFTEQNSALTYSGQSGGINEAFSDIAGEASEYFMKNTNDWMVGAQIFKSTGALRYFDDPTKDGRSIGSAKNFTSGMDVHYSSGVFNKAFYLLSHINGWNTKKSFDAFVKANQAYWTASATFISGGQGVVDAARALGYPTADVITAFQGVDVTGLK